ncbi:WYL domain-containing protein, partial [Streptomyces sp. NPDC046727]|uniref:WYL domain-containing protein n=1 Tax=Streptomyces sp. NPDC046727 TaxID=3155373 RepID=UPI0033DC06FD
MRRTPRAVHRPRHDAGTDGPDADSWMTVTLPVESEEVAHSQLTGLGPEAEVLEPPGL